MADMHGKLPIPVDEDGTIARQCPNCHEVFRVVATDMQYCEDGRLYCPCCGMLNQWERFTPQEVIDEAMVRLKNMAITAINDAMKDFGRGIRQSKHVSYKPGKPIPLAGESPVRDTYISLEPVQTPCCARTVKVHQTYANAGIYCPYCGVK